MLEMPYEVKRDLEEMEKLVKQIQHNYITAMQKEIEPFIREISLIKSMYPEPLLMETLQAMNLGLLPHPLAD